MIVWIFFFLSYFGWIPNGSSNHDENQEGIKLIASFIEHISLYPLFCWLSIDNSNIQCIRAMVIVNCSTLALGSGNVIVRRCSSLFLLFIYFFLTKTNTAARWDYRLSDWTLAFASEIIKTSTNEEVQLLNEMMYRCDAWKNYFCIQLE